MPINENGDESLESKNKNESLSSEQLKISHQGPVARRSQKVVALEKPRNKFQAYTLFCFQIQPD